MVLETALHLNTLGITKKDKEVWSTSEQGYLLSQIFKPISTARRQLKMKGIIFEIERLKRCANTSIVDRAGVRFIKTRDMDKGGGTHTRHGRARLRSK